MAKNRFRILVVFLTILVLFPAYQLIMYRLEGGVLVADVPGEQPLSERILYGQRTLKDAASSTEKVRWINNEGVRGYDIKPYMSWKDKWAYWNALRKFPSLKQCLLPSAKDTQDTQQFNWSAIRTNRQSEICLIHIATALSEPKAIGEWIESQNFRITFDGGWHTSKKWPGDRAFSFSAAWQKKENGSSTPYPIFSTITFIEQYGLNSLILGAVGTPKFQIFMVEKAKILKVSTTSLPSK